MYQNASEMWSNKYMYMPFNITSHTNIQFDLEKQSHSMLSMQYRSLYRLCLFSHWEVHKPVTTLTLYVCALKAHYFNTDSAKSTVFSGQVFDSRTHSELQKTQHATKIYLSELAEIHFFVHTCFAWFGGSRVQSHLTKIDIHITLWHGQVLGAMCMNSITGISCNHIFEWLRDYECMNIHLGNIVWLSAI